VERGWTAVGNSARPARSRARRDRGHAETVPTSPSKYGVKATRSTPAAPDSRPLIKAVSADLLGRCMDATLGRCAAKRHPSARPNPSRHGAHRARDGSRHQPRLERPFFPDVHDLVREIALERRDTGERIRAWLSLRDAAEVEPGRVRRAGPGHDVPERRIGDGHLRKIGPPRGRSGFVRCTSSVDGAPGESDDRIEPGRVRIE